LAGKVGAAEETPADQQLAEVTVTGIRAALQSALNLKRTSDVMVDAINAEDVAKFPDSNLAESLQRLPGISVDPDNGEGRTITVRGLGSDFTRVRLNGRRALRKVNPFRATKLSSERSYILDPGSSTPPVRPQTTVNGLFIARAYDAELTYNIGEHLTLTLEGLNLTAETDDRWVYQADPIVAQYSAPGRRYFAGFRLQF
jgi:outer membrane receptor for ferrienterochelin and colicin